MHPIRYERTQHSADRPRRSSFALLSLFNCIARILGSLLAECDWARMSAFDKQKTMKNLFIFWVSDTLCSILGKREDQSLYNCK